MRQIYGFFSKDVYFTLALFLNLAATNAEVIL